MTETDIVARLRPHPRVADDASVMYRAGDIRQVFTHLNLLEERCAALAGQVEAGAAEIERLRAGLTEAIREMRDQASARGEAEGRLRASVWPAVIDGWRDRAEAAEARANALQAEVGRLREIVASFVAMVEDSMSGTTHPEVGRFVPGVTDLELRPDGSLKLSDARAALQHQEPKP